MSSTIDISSSTEKILPKKKGDVIQPVNHFMEHIVTLGSIATIAVSAYFLHLAYLEEVTYFTYHIILYTIGWMLMMVEAITMVTRNNICLFYVNTQWRIWIHAVVEVAAVCLSAGGFAVAFKNAEGGRDPHHFQSKHGKLGYAAQILAFITFANGLLALFAQQLRKIIPPKINKLFHACTGIFTIAVGCATLVYVLYMRWFTRRTDNNHDIYIACYVALCAGTFLCLIQPCMTFIQRFVSLFR